MKILFLKSVPRQGQVGEVKDVAPGFASFLLKSGAAVVATDIVVKQNQKKIEEAKMKSLGADSFAKELGKKVDGLKLEIKGNGNEKGNLYKSFHAKDIAEELTKKIIVGVDPELIEEITIKNKGTHTAKMVYKGKTLATFEVEIV